MCVCRLVGTCGSGVSIPVGWHDNTVFSCMVFAFARSVLNNLFFVAFIVRWHFRMNNAAVIYCFVAPLACACCRSVGICFEFFFNLRVYDYEIDVLLAPVYKCIGNINMKCMSLALLLWVLWHNILYM